MPWLAECHPMPHTAAETADKVRAQYERFPYPDYGLFLPLRIQEAYASHSLFAARLAHPKIRVAPGPVLLAGCGDTFPYLAAAWEPRQQALIALDLSASSLRRARLRCFALPRTFTWRRGDMEDQDFVWPRNMAHVDCYGVLHHLSRPGEVLQKLATALRPGGTARIMVYNREARTWLRHIQQALAALGLSPHAAEDRAHARRLLLVAERSSPALHERFASMRHGAFASESRFVDTFMHAREARLGLAYWLQAIGAADLRPLGLFDRYGELDDLPNPLWQWPDAKAWQERIDDRRFENNFEMYLARNGAAPPGPALQRLSTPWRLSPFFRLSPPALWFSYDETRNLNPALRLRLWRHFLSGLVPKHGTTASIDAWAKDLAPEALQRLARIGALFRDDMASPELQALALAPRHAMMEAPLYLQPIPLTENRALREEVVRILVAKEKPPRLAEGVLKRFDAAQRP